MRDHGGNLDRAIAHFGGAAEDWIDLSTGINPRPYPVPDIDRRAWATLPTRTDIVALISAAQAAYATGWTGLAVAGAQAAIQMVPLMRPVGEARVLSPTYNEHAASLRDAGWAVREVGETDHLSGAGLAVVVNPNNPDGRKVAPEALRTLALEVDLLVVDESFADVTPELSLLGGACPDNLLVLRSFGKFFGLAGLRLGFAFGAPDLIAALAARAGPWPISGPAIAIGRRALANRAWQGSTRNRLRQDAARMDKLAAAAGWSCAGGTNLFRTYVVGNAHAAQDRLARAHIWSRVFPYRNDWLRLGLPDAPADWARLEAALAREGQ